MVSQISDAKTNSLVTKMMLVLIVLSSLEHILNIEVILYGGAAIILILCYLKIHTIKRDSLLILVFLLYCFISCGWSVAPDAYKSLLSTVIVYLVLFLALQFEYTQEEYERFKIAFLIQGWLIFSFAMLFGSVVDGRLWIKTTSSGVDPNYLSGWLLLPIGFCMEYYKKDVKKIYKAINTLEIVCLLYVIAVSGSRSGLVTASIIILGSLVYIFSDIIKKNPLQCFILLILVIISFTIAIKNMPAIMLNRLSSVSGGDLGGRGSIWSELVLKLSNNLWGLIFGFGQNATRYIDSNNVVAHNTFLDIWTQQGILGLTMYIILCATWIKKCCNKSFFMKISFVSVLVLIFTLTSLAMRFLILSIFMAGCDIKCSFNEYN